MGTKVKLPKLAMAYTQLPEPEQHTQEKIEYVIEQTKTRNKFWEASVAAHDEDPSFAIKEYCKENNIDFPAREVYELEDQAVQTIKFWKRKFAKLRPYAAAEHYGLNVDRLPSKTNKTKSYPSGHSTQGYLAGLYVSSIYPSHRVGIMEAGLECGIGRIKAGFHYLNDHEAGMNLATQLFNLVKT
jgi:hypothetical protein|tara:strand:+ start:104 stop:658 length:555 start_codon:yes stop_codon:yes gene_type:complete